MKLILEMLIRFYVNKYSKININKLSDEEELDRYKFKSSLSVLDVLKNNMMIQTLRHFEAGSEKERWMTKGAALWLQIMKDRHLYALKLESVKDKKKQIELWKKFKISK